MHAQMNVGLSVLYITRAAGDSTVIVDASDTLMDYPSLRHESCRPIMAYNETNYVIVMTDVCVCVLTDSATRRDQDPWSSSAAT